MFGHRFLVPSSAPTEPFLDFPQHIGQGPVRTIRGPASSSSGRALPDIGCSSGLAIASPLQRLALLQRTAVRTPFKDSASLIIMAAVSMLQREPAREWN